MINLVSFALMSEDLRYCCCGLELVWELLVYNGMCSWGGGSLSEIMEG